MPVVFSLRIEGVFHVNRVSSLCLIFVYFILLYVVRNTFYVKYDKNGDLTVGDRQIQDYSLPEFVSEQVTKNPVVFWI